MAPLPTITPHLSASASVGLKAKKRVPGAAAEEAEEAAGSVKRRPLEVSTHFLRDDEEHHLALKIKLPAEFDERSVQECIVQPFIEAYDAQFPDAPASGYAPFVMIKVRIWSGPRPCAADKWREADRFGAEDVQTAEKPVDCLVDTMEPVSILRGRAHNKLKPAIEVELVAVRSTALVVREVANRELVVRGDELSAMLVDTAADPAEMHAIVDAAIAGGELAYLGLVSARDRNGRSALHL
jgi:hypothetical protein